MAARNVSLTPEWGAFIDRQVESGLHASASEVVRTALRLYEAELRREEAYLAALRGVADRGRADIAAGRFTLIDGADAEDALFERLTGRKNPNLAGQRAGGSPRGG